ncbi:hypothetical protein GCM10017562_02350 [Streptomyces roseofulvus]
MANLGDLTPPIERSPYRSEGEVKVPTALTTSVIQVLLHQSFEGPASSTGPPDTFADAVDLGTVPAEDDGVVARYRHVGSVVGHEPDVAVLAAQALDGGFAVEHHGDDVAVHCHNQPGNKCLAQATM